MKQLIGNVSPQTAYVVPDYPYGFRLRTQIRYWVESKKNFGQRFVSQTLNPKTGKWNAPKAGTYHEAVVLLVNSDDTSPEFGYVHHDALSIYSDNEQIQAFVDKYELGAELVKYFQFVIQKRTEIANRRAS